MDFAVLRGGIKKPMVMRKDVVDCIFNLIYESDEWIKQYRSKL